jgi:TolA-binding protein
MRRKTCVLLLSGFVAAFGPFCSLGYSAASASAMSAASRQAAEEQADIGKAISASYQRFMAGEAISGETIQLLRQRKDELLPLLQSGIAMHGSILQVDDDQDRNFYREWQFWLELARLIGDPRVEPFLTAWLSERRPLLDSYQLSETLSDLLPSGREEVLLAQLDRASSAGTAVILHVLAERKKLSEAQLQEWLKKYANQPQIGGMIDYIAGRPNGKEQLMHLYDSGTIPLSMQRRIIGHLASTDEWDWLKKQAERTADPYIEQLIDIRLVRDKGDKQAAARLYGSGMKHGFLLPLDGLTEKFLADLYPDGELAKGIAAYEKIRGSRYFYHDDGENWHSYQSSGSDFRQPKQAIPQWLSFIEKYPLHPAVDDAAYRLARCYQQTGEYERALYWFHQTTRLGDRDLLFDAMGQFLYTLDVEMGADALAELDSSRLPDWAKPWTQYSLAVEYLRQRDYARAKAELQRFIATYQGKNLFLLNGEGQDRNTDFLAKDELVYSPHVFYYPFWQKVERQLALAAELAAQQARAEQASGAEKAKKQYELAATIYRSPLLYYNYLWRGERQSFFWLGHIKYMEYNEALDRYIGRFNHLVQAIDAFSRINLEQADAETAAKTLFSLALSHSKLIDYGEEVRFFASKTQLGQQIIRLSETLVKRFPSSQLADDALLLAYHYSQDRQYLQQLLERYPQGDQAQQARAILENSGKQTADQNYRHDPLRATLPCQTLQLSDWRVPPQIREWVEQHRGADYQGIRQDGEWLYAYISAKQGEQAFVEVETDLSGTFFRYARQKQNLNVGREFGDLLIRLPYRFIQQNKLEWKPY